MYRLIIWVFESSCLFLFTQLSQVLKGASAPNPDLLFVLIQKVSKNIKTSPASLEKSTFGRLKSSKLVEVRPIDCNFKSAHYELQLQTMTIFNRLPLLFFGSPAEVARPRAASLCVSLLFHFKWKNQRFAENINTNEQYPISL